MKASLREMIRIRRNHPSIIVWSVSNEPFFSDKAVFARYLRIVFPADVKGSDISLFEWTIL